MAGLLIYFIIRFTTCTHSETVLSVVRTARMKNSHASISLNGCNLSLHIPCRMADNILFAREEIARICASQSLFFFQPRSFRTVRREKREFAVILFSFCSLFFFYPIHRTLFMIRDVCISFLFSSFSGSVLVRLTREKKTVPSVFLLVFIFFPFPTLHVKLVQSFLCLFCTEVLRFFPPRKTVPLNSSAELYPFFSFSPVL